MLVDHADVSLVGPAKVPRVQASGLVADEVCGIILVVPGFAVCPPAYEGSQLDTAASTVPSKAYQGAWGSAAFIFCLDKVGDVREGRPPAVVRQLGERACSPFHPRLCRLYIDRHVQPSIDSGVHCEDAFVALACLAEPVIGQDDGFPARLIIVDLVGQHGIDDESDEDPPALTTQDMPCQLAVAVPQIAIP